MSNLKNRAKKPKSLHQHECVMCKNAFTVRNPRVIRTHGDMVLVHIRCNSCTQQQVALVHAANTWSSNVRVATDLSAEELTGMQHIPSISVDDVMNVYNLLTSQGDNTAGPINK